MGTLFLVLTAVLFSASYVNQNKMMTLQNAQSSNVIPFLFGIMWSLLTACGWWITIIIQGDWTFIPMDILFAAIGGITAGACNLCYVMSLYHGPLSLSSVTLGLGRYCSGCTGRYFSWTASYRNSVCRTWTYNRCYDYR